MKITNLKRGGGVTKTYQENLFGDSGSNPTSPQFFKVRLGKFNDFRHLLKRHHYKSDNIGGGIAFHIVLKLGVKTVGGAILGEMRHKDKYNNSIEIRRMVLDPICPKNTASYFLSKIIWWLKNNTGIVDIYTFADKTVGHKGICYKAANFKFIKETKKSRYIIWNGKRYHPRSLTINRPYSYELREAVINKEAQIVMGLPKILFKYSINRK